MALPVFMVSAQNTNVVIGVEKPRKMLGISTTNNQQVINSSQNTAVEVGVVTAPLSDFSQPKSPTVKAEKEEGFLNNLDYFYPPAPELVSEKPALLASNDNSIVFKQKVIVKVVEEKQLSLFGSNLAYLIVTNQSDRVYVSKDDGRVHFRAQEGSLKSNVEALLSATTTKLPNGLVWGVSEQHLNLTDMWMVGDNALDILEQLLLSYNEPHPIKSTAWANRVVEIFYDTKNRRGM